jgi:hypothetical protein
MDISVQHGRAGRLRGEPEANTNYEGAKMADGPRCDVVKRGRCFPAPICTYFV